MEDYNKEERELLVALYNSHLANIPGFIGQLDSQKEPQRDLALSVAKSPISTTSSAAGNAYYDNATLTFYNKVGLFVTRSRLQIRKIRAHSKVAQTKREFDLKHKFIDDGDSSLETVHPHLLSLPQHYQRADGRQGDLISGEEPQGNIATLDICLESLGSVLEHASVDIVRNRLGKEVQDLKQRLQRILELAERGKEEAGEDAEPDSDQTS